MAQPVPPGAEKGAGTGAVLLAILGWCLAIAVNLAAIALAVWILRYTTPATVPFAAVGLIVLISLAIALSIWVAVRFGNRVRRMGRTD